MKTDILNVKYNEWQIIDRVNTISVGNYQRSIIHTHDIGIIKSYQSKQYICQEHPHEKLEKHQSCLSQAVTHRSSLSSGSANWTSCSPQIDKIVALLQ